MSLVPGESGESLRFRGAAVMAGVLVVSLGRRSRGKGAHYRSRRRPVLLAWLASVAASGIETNPRQWE